MRYIPINIPTIEIVENVNKKIQSIIKFCTSPIKPTNEFIAIINKEVPTAFFMGNLTNKISEGIIKKPPPAPTNPMIIPIINVWIPIRIKFLLNSSAKVNMNTDELRQVFSNLIQNSIDALSLTSKKNKVIKIKTLTKNNKLFLKLFAKNKNISICLLKLLVKHHLDNCRNILLYLSSEFKRHEPEYRKIKSVTAYFR